MIAECMPSLVQGGIVFVSIVSGGENGGHKSHTLHRCIFT
jgi:hypothetical protein